MALFLNTPKLNYWIPKLIREAENEIILIVPYIKTSDNILNALKEAQTNDVEITLIYREDKLTIKEKEKLLSLENINLLHHPNIHCKCYFNGDILIIGSMNLYAYSERNNREMGTLFSREEINLEDLAEPLGNFNNYADDEEIFLDSIIEIREIVNGATFEKVSRISEEDRFELYILKTDEELIIEHCDEINGHFLNKKFIPFEDSKGLWLPRCNNFFDKIDVVFQYRRIAITFNIEESELKELYTSWMEKYDEFEFIGFKYYWNYFNSDLLIYRDSKYDWNSLREEPNLYYKKINEGIISIIKKYRIISGK